MQEHQAAGLTYDPSWGRRPAARLGRALIRGGLRPLIWLHVAPKVAGTERLADVAGPVIVAANHASHLDTPVIMQSLPRPLRGRIGVVAAADYFFTKRWKAGLVTLAFATLPIERRRLSETTRGRINAMIEDGWSMLVYPEGTRSLDGHLQMLKYGTAHFAIDYGLPIVPVYLTGTFQAHGKGSKWPSRHPVTVRFGEPIAPPTDLAPDERRAATERLTATLTDALRALAAESGVTDP